MMTARPLTQPPQNAASYWPWLASAAEMAVHACADLAHPGPSDQSCCPRVTTRTLGGNLESIAAARGFARGTLQRWGLVARRDDITLVLSELLANALRHTVPRPGGWPVRFGLLELLPSPAVLCAVADPCPDPPVLDPPGYLAESGRGLQVVDELSDRWGYTAPCCTGKVVWAAFGVAAGRAPADENQADPAAPRGAAGRHRAVGEPCGAGAGAHRSSS
jgi:hypothetical protein